MPAFPSKSLIALPLIVAGIGCSPIVERYEAVQVGPHAFSGVHDPDEDYLVGLLVCNVSLKPAKVTEVTTTAGNFFNTVSGQYTNAAGWTYQSAANRLSNNTLEIKTYDAQGSAVTVGADIHIRYRPKRSDPAANIHWIQVVSNNHRLATNIHGDNDNKVDNFPGQADPYYDTNGLADSGACAPVCNYYDKPRRADPGMDHTWDAVLFVTQGPAAGTPGNIVFLEPGMSWGWQNTCVPLELPRLRWFYNLIGSATLVGDGIIEPGRADTLSLVDRATFAVRRDNQAGEAELTQLQLTIGVDPEVEPQISPEAHLWAFNVTGGAGLFGPIELADIALPETPFEVIDGDGVIQPAGGGFSGELRLQFSPPNLSPFTATALLYGRLDEEGVLTLGPGTQILEDEPAE